MDTPTDTRPPAEPLAEPAAPGAPITVYRARRRGPRIRRRWVRVALWSVLSLLVVGVAGAGGFVYFEVYAPLQTLTSLKGRPELQRAQRNVDLPPPAGQAATALLIGYDHRYADGNAPSRSDTLMLVRIDPTRHTLSMLSLPRDLRAAIPGYGYDKINAAYSLGGPDLTLRTVKQLLGIKINYLIPIDFRGFVQTVDVFGGVYLDVERRYYNHNDGLAIHDYADINLQPGYQLVRGADALAYVRYRHLDSDIYRLARQQAFVREFKRQVDAWTAATNLTQLVGVVKDNVKIVGAVHHEPGLRTLLRYAQALSDVPRSRMFQVRIEGDQGTVDSYVNATQGELSSAVQEFLHPDVAAGAIVARRDVGGHAPGQHPRRRTTKALRPIAPGQLRVVALNGSTTLALAAAAADQLVTAGYRRAAVGDLPLTGGDAWSQGFGSSVVYYASARARLSAQALAARLGNASLRPFPHELAALRGRADVVLVAGSAFRGLAEAPVRPVPTPGVPARTAPDVQAAPADALPVLVQKQRELGTRILYPTLVPTGTQYGEPAAATPPYPPFRVYAIKHHGKAMHLTARRGYASTSFVDTAHTWGVQWLHWSDAPILAQPTAVRVVDGRRWQIYANGGTIHRIAVFYGKGNVVWIDNSLSDAYSSSTMVAIARSLRLVPRR